MSGVEDTSITDFFIDGAFLSRDEVDDVLAALEAAPDGLSTPEIEAAINVSKGRIDWSRPRRW